MKMKKVISMVVASVLAVSTLLGGLHLGAKEVKAAGPKNISGTCDNDKWHYYYYKDTNSVGLRVRTQKITKADKTISYPNTVKIDKKSYNVTKILNDQNYECECKQCKEARKNKKKDAHSEAFYKYVSKVVIPKNVTEIGGSAFSECCLTSVEFPADSKLKKICNGPSEDEEYEWGAFSNNNLKSINLPKSIEKIGVCAFSENDSLGSVNLSQCANLKNIEESAFMECNLKSVSFPQSLAKLGSGAFENNNIAGTVIIPNGVKKIGGFCFSNNAIKTVKLGNAVKEISSVAFYENNITDINIPASVKKIGEEAFWGNNIKKVTISGDNVEIDDCSFGNNELVEVVLAGNKPSVGYYAFEGNNISKVVLKGKEMGEMDETSFNDNPIKDSDNPKREKGNIEIDNYNVYEYLYENSVFGDAIKVKAAKTRVETENGKKDVAGNSKIDLIDSFKIPDDKELVGVVVLTVDNMAFKTTQQSLTGDSIKSFPLNNNVYVYIVKPVTRDKKYTIKGLGFELLTVDGKKKSEYQDGDDYKLAVSDEVKFQPYPDDEKFAKVGYHISGYKFTGDSAPDTVFKANTTASKLSKANGTIQLELEYEANNYKIQYKKNGGNAFTIADTECVYDQEAKLTEEVPTRDGYKFIGWSLDEDDAENVYNSGDTVKNLAEKDGAVVCMYAQWKKAKKTVEFDINPDEASEGLDPEMYTVKYSINGDKPVERAYPADDGAIHFEVSEVYVGDVIVVEVTGSLEDAEDDGNLLESDPSTLTVKVE